MTANRIVQHIFQQPALPQVTEAALEELVSEYPYFTAARLLLARKGYDRFPNLYAPAIKKAQLYSNNQHYFYQFVTGELEKPMADPIAVVENQSFTVPSYSEPAPEVAAETTTSANWWEQKEPEAPAAPVEETTTSKNWWEQPVQEDNEPETPAAAVEATTTTKNWWEQPVQEDDEPEAPAAPVEATTATKNWWEQPVQEDEPVAPQPASGINIIPPAATTAPEGPATVEKPAAEEPIKIYPLEIPEEETTLTFQPLYSDDYFAYKRIKEPEQADELNEKGMAEMRSFTDWLREMKTGFAQKANRDWYHQQLHRIYEDEAPEVSETVEKMAMESITLNDDIVSETLAEVWARQRQYQTAIQIYQKLSLLNPNKSAYFAQKIQELQSYAMQSESNKS